MYCTRDDIAELIPERTLTQLSNDDPKATLPNWEIVDRSIRFATNSINGFLRGRYTLPLVGVDELVKEWTTFIARWWLYNRRPDGKELPHAVVVSYDNAIANLKLVQSGKLNLGDGSSNASNTAGNASTPNSTGTTTGNGDMLTEGGQIKVRSGLRQFDANRLSQY